MKFENDKEKEQYLFRIVYKTCNYFGITPKKIPSKEMKKLNEDIADLVMLELLDIK